MDSGWMVFLWVGAAAGILLVWLVIAAVVVMYFEDRHATDAEADRAPTQVPSEPRVPTSVS